MPSFRVIILCAGIAERLRPLTYENNKSLVEIGDKTLIEHFLDSLIKSGADVDKVHIVIGHYGYKFRKLLGNEYGGLKINFLENKLYKITGAAQSLYLADSILRGNPCIVLEGDHYLHPEMMRLLTDSEYQNAVLVDTRYDKINFDEEVLAYGYRRAVTNFKWLPPYPEDPLGEAPMVFKFNRKACSDLATILEAYLLEDGPAKREIVEPINRLLKFNEIHYIASRHNWVEIDFPEDLEYARRLKFE